VERFDIKQTDTGLERKHMHSLSGIMHQNPVETTFDYTNLFRVGDKLNIPHADKEQFFKMMVFNLIFGNRDDHTRNFSYLMDSTGKWKAAPAYDLTFSSKAKHQMLFDYKNANDVKVKDILKIADDFNISGAKETIESMTELKHALLPKLAREHDVKEWGEEVIASTSKILTL
jgi:serine/threonine-protein kinase HipA